MACSLTVDGAIAPNWVLGLACGAGGLTGGYLGARLKPRMPETVLRAAAGRARDRPGPGMLSPRFLGVGTQLSELTPKLLEQPRLRDDQGGKLVI